MSIDTLQQLLRDHDTEKTGYLNKIEWVRLCTGDGINLTSELADTLFDGLDTDADGQVKIGDIMKELSAFEANAELYNSPSLNQRTPGGISSSHTDLRDRKKSQDLYGMTKGFFQDPYSRQFPQYSPTVDGYMTRKEYGEDGTEIFCTTPALVNPRQKQLIELEQQISRSNPELLPTFNNIVEDFRTEIRSTLDERTTLEQNYLNEKEARKRDLMRMETELEQQISRIEEKTKVEMTDLLRTEYDAEISNKEKEINSIRAQVVNLRARIKEKDNNTPDSTTNDYRGRDYELRPRSFAPESRPRSRQYSTQEQDEAHLSDVLHRLQDRESELAFMKEEMALQERQILMDKRELLNKDEEKLQLHSQLQDLKVALERQDDEKMRSHFFNGNHSTYSNNSGAGSSLDAAFREEVASEMNSTPRAPERIFKVILVGDTGVGKSSFMHQFCDGVFYPRLRATVGVDFRTRNLRVDQTVYSIQLWDTAGQEKYRSIVRTYFRKVDGVVIVYDVTAPDTFHNVRIWMEQIADFSTEAKVPVILVGNKIDLRDEAMSNCVTTEAGKKFAEPNETGGRHKNGHCPTHQPIQHPINDQKEGMGEIML